jgi:aliphatic nitrilase
VSDYSLRFRAAVVQAEPVWNDANGGVDKTVALATEAAAHGADIIAFPEVWIPGYPWFLWLDSVAWQSRFTLPYAQNSLQRDSILLSRIEKAARELGIAMSLGFSERDRGSLYIAQAFISKDGVTQTVRRKLKPTHVERTLFGEGDGSDIQVIDTEFGRFGALNCWEHLQPLAKYAMFSQGEQLHVAAWPSFSLFEGMVHALGTEVNVGAARQYAVEGQTFVLSPTAIVGVAGQALVADTDEKKKLLSIGGGHARIFGPDGRELAEPIPPAQEGLLYADIDYAAILTAKNAADPVGHYSRPDVFQLYFDNSRKATVINRPVWTDSEAEPVDTELARLIDG